MKLRKKWFGTAATAAFAVSLYFTFTPTGGGGGAAPVVRSDITVSVLTQGNAVVGVSQATASITPTADCLVLAAVQSSLGTIPDEPTASGNGLTYTAVESFLLNGDARRLTVFEAMGSTPSAGAITFDWGAEDQTSAVWAVLQFCGVDQTTPILQTTSNTAVGTLTVDGTLATLEHENNVGVSFTGIDLGTVTTEDVDWTPRTNQTIGTGAQRLMSATALQQETASPTSASAVDWGIVMLEVRSDGGDAIAGMDLVTPWDRHTILAGVVGAGNFDGADGVDVGIIGGSQLAVVSGSEQGAKAGIALRPAVDIEDEWPSAIVPSASLTGPEDAILFDVDLDGFKDIIMGLEGGRRITILYASTNSADWLTASTWQRVDVDASTTEGHRVMRVAAGDFDDDGDIELVAGAKENDSPTEESFIRVYSSTTPRTAASWTGADVAQVGWVKQMLALDMDGDTDLDLVWSDGSQVNFPSTTTAFAGIWWAENDGAGNFTPHDVVDAELAWEWFSVIDWDSNGELDVFGCRSNASFSESSLWLSSSAGTVWTEQVVAQPINTGECQHATAVDIDLDGDLDPAFSYNHADPNLSGVAWLQRSGPAASPTFQRGEIAGTADGSGIKFDNLFWIDLDEDGDLDAVTSEQHEPDATGPGIGLVWYENPRL